MSARRQVGAGRPLTRRQVLLAAALAPLAATACTAAGSSDAVADPLPALAAAARADAELARAALASDPELAGRVEPLRAARAAHAAALDAEIARVDPSATIPTAVPVTGTPDLPAVRAAASAAAEAAAAALPAARVDQVGLVASIAACCSTYAAVLT